MQLENTKRDFLVDSVEETTKMSISKDVESHIVKVLTESYSDPLGSAIREAVSNAVDSTTEAGTNEPVIVSIKKNVAQQNELTVEDKGLGLDDASFKKYIMGLGESTKRDNPNLLGGFGAGAKAWLAYTDSFNYTCRKDGVERKYMIFKGEEYPESTLIYEKETTEPNGVIVSVILKSGWYEVDTCKIKIRQQLSYLDNVYYDIEGFNNQYTVYRTEDFQFSDLGTFSQMHISLKDIYYPIDWNKLKIKLIDVPVALRFTDYEDMKPIFNRESIQYNAATIKAIEDKIVKVADWFAEKWNEQIKEYANIREARPALTSSSKKIKLFEQEFDIKHLVTCASIPINSPKVKDIEFRDPSFYTQMGDSIVSKWEATAYDERGMWRKRHVNYNFQNEAMKSPRENGSRIVLVDYEVSGNIKEYLRDKYRAGWQGVIYIKEKSKKRDIKNQSYNYNERSYESLLQLSDIREEDWDFYINEFNIVENQYESTFIDERGLPLKQEYIDWLDKRKEDRKAGRLPASSNYVALNKEKGQITVYKARDAVRGDGVTYDKEAMDIENLKRLSHMVIYFPTAASPVNSWIQPEFIRLFTRHYKVWKLNPSEVKHVKDLKQFLSIEQFMKSKAFARIATKLLIDELFRNDPPKVSAVIDTFKDVAELREKLYEYTSRDDNRYFSCSGGIKDAILEQARETNTWDMEIYPFVAVYEKRIKQFGFMRVLKDINSWGTDETEKAIIKNMMYIMLKHQKISAKMVDEFELVPKPEPVPEPEETTDPLVLDEATCEGDEFINADELVYEN